MLRRTFLKLLAAVFGVGATARGSFATQSEAPPRVARPQSYPYALIHEQPGCGQMAFRLAHRPELVDLMNSAMVAHIDGRPMEPFSEIRCDSCGARLLRGLQIADVKFVGVPR